MKTKIRRIAEIGLCLLLFSIQIILEANRHGIIAAVKASKLYHYSIVAIEVGKQPLAIIVCYSTIYFLIFITIVYLFSKNKPFTKLLAGMDIGLLAISMVLLVLKKTIFSGLDILPEELNLVLYRLTNSPLLYIIVIPTYFLYSPIKENKQETKSMPPTS